MICHRHVSRSENLGGAVRIGPKSDRGGGVCPPCLPASDIPENGPLGPKVKHLFVRFAGQEQKKKMDRHILDDQQFISKHSTEIKLIRTLALRLI